MAAGVRIAVKHDEAVRCAVNYQAGLVLLRPFLDFTEHTLTGCWVTGTYVFGTPGTPQPVQCLIPLTDGIYKIGGWCASSGGTLTDFSAEVSRCELSLISSLSSLPGLK